MKSLTLALIGLLMVIIFTTSGRSKAQSQLRYLYISQPERGNVTLVTMNPVDQSSTTREIVVPQDFSLYQALLSPDQQWVAIIPEDNLSSNSILLYHLDSGHMIESSLGISVRTHPPYFPLGDNPQVVWAPTSQHLAIISRGYGVVIYHIASGTKNSINTHPSYYLGNLTWSGDGQYLAYVKYVCDFMSCDLYLELFNLLTNTLEFTSTIYIDGNSAYQICSLSFSPDNHYLSYVIQCEPTIYIAEKEVYLFDRLTQTSIQITNFTEVGRPLMPNGDNPNFVYRRGEYNMYWYDADTLWIGAIYEDVPTGIATNTVIIRTATLEYDTSHQTLSFLANRALFELTPRPGTHEFAALNRLPDNKNEVQLVELRGNQLLTTQTLPDSGCGFDWTSDGAWLAYSSSYHAIDLCQLTFSGITLVDMTTGNSYPIPVQHPDKKFALVGWIHD